MTDPVPITINAGSHTFRLTAHEGLVLRGQPMLRLEHPNGSLALRIPAALFPFITPGDPDIIITIAAFRARATEPESALLLPDTAIPLQ